MPGGDRGEDHQRDAVADAALGDQLTEPHEQHATRGQRDHDQHHLREGERAADDADAAAAEGVEEEDVAERLGEGEGDGQIARVLRDLLLADLALLLQLLERGDDHRQQLQDDRCRDVGHDPEGEQRQLAQGAAAEDVEEAEDVAAREVALDLVEGVRVDAGRRDVGAEPVQGQHRRREGELAPDLRDREGVGDRAQHQLLGDRRREPRACGGPTARADRGRRAQPLPGAKASPRTKRCEAAGGSSVRAGFRGRSPEASRSSRPCRRPLRSSRARWR